MIHPQPKPIKRKTVKRKKHAAERSVKQAIRKECVERDGYCRICDWENNPNDMHEGDGGQDELPYPATEWESGPSEWAHLGAKKRARTRGQAPEVRHTRQGSLMLCRFHHRAYDAGRVLITGNNADESLFFRCAE